MPIFRVIRKSDQAEVYSYSHTERIEWVDWPFSEYDHIEVVDPPAPPPHVEPVRITKLAFRNRFTSNEKAALEIAALHNPSLAASHPANLLAASLRASMADQRDAAFIDLTRADTRGGVQVLEQVGLLAAGRAAAILDTPPTEEERWHG